MAFSIPLLVASALMYWYQWSSSALLPSDVDRYMTLIEAQTQNPGGRHDLSTLREFLSEDDGDPVYTVNLYDFHDIADYPEGSRFDGTGAEAYNRFSDAMIPLMTKRGSHPVYGSNWSDQANSNWDRIVIVRYRSRRDLVDLFATKQFADASLHKWASLRDHERMLVHAIHIPDAKIVIVLIAILIGLGIYLVGAFSMRKREI